ncbi:unnamed protein product [Strongylus vulgaris]|uniref:Uncharacterized protein n=1 Tax=Strongylus vulgaris TaxID=40348 RepID=A0A3P7L088_STRVU|nr:unnamed protein product [Strongylus vulgaris]
MHSILLHVMGRLTWWRKSCSLLVIQRSWPISTVLLRTMRGFVQKISLPLI